MGDSFSKNTVRKPKKEKESEAPKLPKFKFGFGMLKDKRFGLAFGLFCILFSLFAFTAMVSFLFNGAEDQSIIENTEEVSMRQSGLEIENWLGMTGAVLAYYLIYRWFGISAFLVLPVLFLFGYRMLFGKNFMQVNVPRVITFCCFFLAWISFALGYLTLDLHDAVTAGFWGGGIGYELSVLFHGLLGWGTLFVLLFSFAVFAIFFFDIRSFSFGKSDEFNETEAAAKLKEEEDKASETDYELDYKNEFKINDPLMGVSEEDEELDTWKLGAEVPKKEKTPVDGILFEVDRPEDHPEPEPEEPEKEGLDLEFGELIENDEIVDEGSIEEFEQYDPTLDLSSYQFPTLDLLIDAGPSKVNVTKEELEANKDNIVKTLGNYNIGIASIKATIGPTVTLYEIVPDAGVRISKIRSLEDDIALSLAALGIRIIAPIPGKGTIGIEVPNKNKETVSFKSVVSSEKFVNTDKQLPIVLGRTISNDVYIADLAKMPHLLMAGATGQGKSVGINVILASLLFKKHPSQLKFVLVDPKKVELTLYNIIEKHFLAKLPGNDEAIITDTKKVIYTLNSLCIEMDNRYNLLKDAGCRNLKEYNLKFINRRLNPEKGHRYLPYIVVVIDELADLMMTAGKEVETPIARLAQLARAIGIHLVVATQRPSVNVITGIIKANFPARLSFKVSSKIDSRTILDTGGADQLIGMGDMLLFEGNSLTRIQCAFVDTPEVEKICEFIGSQRGYASAYELPEFEGEDAEKNEFNFADRDTMFDEAARLIVTHQQGSTSLVQRKMSLGYNRAGRIIDQMEMVGIVGPSSGSKAREVYVHDLESLEQLLITLGGGR